MITITVTGEIPSGLINGSNEIFSLVNAPNPPSSFVLFLNGTVVAPLYYTLTGTQIRLTIAPTTGTTLTANYQYQTNRYGYQYKSALLPYIRVYLNDGYTATNPGGALWADSVLTNLINQGEDYVTQDKNVLWQKYVLPVIKGQGLYTMPALLKSITRITYRGYYVDLLTQSQMALLSPVYRTQVSRPRWATLQYEGYYSLRLYPVPYENLPVLSNSTTIYQDVNIQSECHISGYYYANEAAVNVAIPDWMAMRTIRYYVLWKAFAMEGNGQDQAVAEHWHGRFSAQLENNHRYLERVYASKERQYTDVAIQRPWKKYPPILPPNFGTTVDY